jgi:hypothetical protein
MEGKNSAYMGLVGRLKKINLFEDLDRWWRLMSVLGLQERQWGERGLDFCGYE